MCSMWQQHVAAAGAAKPVQVHTPVWESSSVGDLHLERPDKRLRRFQGTSQQPVYSECQ